MSASSLSRKILYGILALFVLALFQLAGPLLRFLALSPSSIYPGFELWRLLSYPATPDIMGLILGSIVFSAPAEEVEGMLGTRRFGMLLLVITAVVGLMHSLVFFGQASPVLHGPVNIALFVLVGFVYLFPQSETRLLFFTVRSWSLLAFFSGVILFWALYAWRAEGAPVMGFFSDGGFGLLLGGVYFHARYQKYTFLLRQIRSVERMAERVRSTGGGPAPTAAPRRATAQQPTRIRIPFQKASSREMTDEERLNSILERISEKSYNSLTEEEKRFLREYSGKL